MFVLPLTLESYGILCVVLSITEGTGRDREHQTVHLHTCTAELEHARARRQVVIDFPFPGVCGMTLIDTTVVHYSCPCLACVPCFPWIQKTGSLISHLQVVIVTSASSAQNLFFYGPKTFPHTPLPPAPKALIASFLCREIPSRRVTPRPSYRFAADHGEPEQSLCLRWPPAGAPDQHEVGTSSLCCGHGTGILLILLLSPALTM